MSRMTKREEMLIMSHRERIPSDIRSALYVEQQRKQWRKRDDEAANQQEMMNTDDSGHALVRDQSKHGDVLL